MTTPGTDRARYGLEKTAHETVSRTLHERVVKVLGVGIPWALVWLAFWALIGLMVFVVDPDSVDSGERWMLLAVFGPMGLLAGVVLGFLLSAGAPSPARADRPVSGVAGAGVLATAIAQLPYLGHGDQGLAANIRMALLFAGGGGLVTLAWHAISRRWRRA